MVKKLTRLPHVVLIAFSLFIAYCWLTRVGNDLSWDEAHNYRMYARHPIVAIALYLEPNNHPLDSLFKSLFYGLLGLNQPAFYRLPGVLLVIIFFVVVWKWVQLFAEAGAFHTAIMLVVLLLVSDGIQAQAMNLRGYFPSIVLVLVYLLVLGKKNQWLTASRAEEDSDRAYPPHHIPRKELLLFSVLSSLLIFTIPSNLPCTAVLWTITVPLRFQVRHAAAAMIRIFLQEWGKLAFMSSLFALILYGPILIGFLIGINRFDNAAGGLAIDVLRGFGKESYQLLSLAAPVGTAVGVFGAGLSALLFGAMLSRQRSNAVYPGALLLVSSFVFSGFFATFFKSEIRIKTPFVPLICVALTLLFHGSTTHWSIRSKWVIGGAIMLAGWLSLPEIIQTTRLKREESELATFLQAYCHPNERHTLICHNRQELSLLLWAKFSMQNVIDGEGDLERTFSGNPQLRISVETPLRKTLLKIFFPEYQFTAVRQADIAVLVYVTHSQAQMTPLSWMHPELEKIKARLHHRVEFTIGQYQIVIFE